jgi:methionyl-tRNA synthetase
VTRLVQRADRELANGLGNLANRTVSLVHRYGWRPDSDPGPLADLTAAARALPVRIDEALGRFDFAAATAAIWDLVQCANRAVERERPWELAHRDATARRDGVLAALVHACRVMATECAPFIPDGAQRLRGQLGTGASVGPVGPGVRPPCGRRSRACSRMTSCGPDPSTHSPMSTACRSGTPS